MQSSEGQFISLVTRP
nr:unnamed protein product [Callosobruchus chinensis]